MSLIFDTILGCNRQILALFCAYILGRIVLLFGYLVPRLGAEISLEMRGLGNFVRNLDQLVLYLKFT